MSARNGKIRDPIQDHCGKIAAGSEVIAKGILVLQQANIKETPETKSVQKESLYQLARHHKAKSDVAKAQAIGWGATASCYGLMAASTPIQVGEVGFIAKLAASTLLTVFYGHQIHVQEKYAEEVRGIAEKLPGGGECNPITERHCFCSEESSKRDPSYSKYCRPSQLHRRPVAKSSTRTICLDSDQKIDPQCQCATTDTCYNKKILTHLNAVAPVPEFAKDYKNYNSLMRGELPGERQVKAHSSLRQGAMGARDKLRKISQKVNFDRPLNKRQQHFSNVLEGIGFPRKVSRILASRPMTADSQRAKGHLKHFKFSPPPHSTKAQAGKVLHFSGGQGLKKKEASQGSKFPFPLLANLKKAKRTTSSSSNKVINFAKKAEQQAQISGRKDRSLFEIISKRYQISGRRRLDKSFWGM